MKGSIRMNTGFMIAYSVFLLLAGGIAGAMIAGKKNRIEYEDIIDRSQDEIRRLSDKLDEKTSDRLQVLRRQESELDESFKSIGVKPKTKYSEVTPRRKNPDLMELAKKYGDPDSDDDVLVGPTVTDYLLEKEGPRDDKEIRPPFEISAEEFEADICSSDMSALRYFKEDGVLVDERDVVILDPKEVVGEDGLEALSDTTEDILYFHNDAYDLNYEIEVLHGMNYRRDILGATDDPIDPDEEDVEYKVDSEEDDFDPRYPG